jgi:GT2 family glycosyltransferase
MQASFIIPLYNGLAYTRECLRTLQATLPPGLSHEIIFVDDGSTDGSREWTAALPRPCRAIFNERNLGFAGACNRGAAAATGEFLFFLNNDLVLSPGWFEPMRFLLRLPRTALVGNVQVRAATGELDHAGVCFNLKGKPEHDLRRPWLARLIGWRTVSAVTGACCAIRRDRWLMLGGFDEGFKNGGEDIDFALRARAAGLSNRVSLRSCIRHHVSASAGRKLRDEQNSRRLAELWRPAILRLIAPAWARRYIPTVWDRAPNWDDALGRQAFWQALHVGSPGAELSAEVDATLEIEFARWRELLDGAPAAPPPPPPPPRGRLDY